MQQKWRCSLLLTCFYYHDLLKSYLQTRVSIGITYEWRCCSSHSYLKNKPRRPESDVKLFIDGERLQIVNKVSSKLISRGKCRSNHAFTMFVFFSKNVWIHPQNGVIITKTCNLFSPSYPNERYLYLLASSWKLS